MGRTQGFDIVAELAQPALLSLMQAAYDSDLIPKNIAIPAGNVAGEPIDGGQVQIPKSGLGVSLAAGFGIQLLLELQIQIKLTNPPVPSASLIEIDANVTTKVPIVSDAGVNNVVLLFSGIPAANKSDATLIGGDPIDPKLPAYITDYVHQAYKQNGPAFPHNQTSQESLVAYNAQVSVDLYDDPADPAHQIQVTFPPNKLRIAIPIHLKIYEIQKAIAYTPDLLAPMGVEADLILLANLVKTPGNVSVDLSMADVSVEALAPAGPAYGVEGPNYTMNKALLGVALNLDDLVTTNLQSRGQDIVKNFAPIEFNYPTPDQLQEFIAQAFHDAIAAKPKMEIWPNGATPPVGVKDLKIVILADVLIIALNARGSTTPGSFNNFVPAGKGFAVAISGEETMDMVNAAINNLFPSLPTTVPNVDGHDVKLNSLSPSLTSALHFSGDVTVVNAILGSIDVDAAFDVDVGLEWLPPDTKGFQNIKSDPGDPDVHLSGLAWLLSILAGYITFGLVGVIIAIVVAAIVEKIASNIGGQLARDAVTNAVEGLQAWPTPLQGVGTVQAAYDKEIDISPDGLLSKG
jgi:hypothetical protein